MKILYVSQHYPPEMGALAGRAEELSRWWASLGHSASVLTGFPNHPSGVIAPEYRSRFRRLFHREIVNGVDVIRTWLLPFPNRRPLERILNYGSFCISAILRGLFLDRPDVVIGTSPPLPIAIAGYVIARVKRAPFIFEVRDLWPESLEGVGLGSGHTPLYRLVAAIVGYLYRHSDHIVVVTPAFKRHLNECWNVPLENLSVVVNGVETGRFAPAPPSFDLRREFGIPDNNLVASYVGTIGMAHGLNNVLDVAQILREKAPNIKLLLVGDGGDRENLQSAARSRGLENVVFAGQQPREKMPTFINCSDICLVMLKNQGVFKTVIPTKMLEYMSCARAVVLAVGGQADEILLEANAGVCVPAENAQAIAEAILTLAKRPDLRAMYGQNGRTFMISVMSREITAHQYLDVLAGLTGTRQESVLGVPSQSPKSGEVV